MPTHTFTMGFKDDSGAVPIDPVAYVVNDEVNALLTVAAGAVNTAYKVQFPFAKVNDYVLAVGIQTAAQVLTGAYSMAKAGSIEVKIDSTSSPTPDLTIQAGATKAFAPCLDGTSNLFTADSTLWYCSNPGTVDLVLVVKMGLKL